MLLIVFFFQAEDGIRDLVRSRGLGDVYKRQINTTDISCNGAADGTATALTTSPTGNYSYLWSPGGQTTQTITCLLYTSDAADERSSVDLGGRRIIKKKKNRTDVGVRFDQQHNNNKR